MTGRRLSPKRCGADYSTNVGRSPDRVVDFFAAEPARASALLRLPLIALIAVLVYVGEVEHWLPTAYGVVLGCYAVSALLWLWLVWRLPVPPWAAAASVTIDVAVLLVLCLVSGGATTWLLPVFLLLPILLTVQESPLLTAVLGLTGAVGYLVVWSVYSARELMTGVSAAVLLQFGFLLWLAAAATLLCAVLARRSERMAVLLDIRRRLLSESKRADDRRNRELAEQLHDGPLQNLLAARLDVEEIRERHPDPALDTVYSALNESAAQLRSTVTAMHPHVLEEAGLTAALRELLRQYESREQFAVESELAEVGGPPAQYLLYRAARELLTNVHKHAQANMVRLRLAKSDGTITLEVTDDGVGFDPRILDRCVSDGHIGLASLVIRIDAVGGAMSIDRPSGGGTRVTITVPASAC